MSAALSELSVQCESEALVSTSASQPQDEPAVKKPTKAQRRKVMIIDHS